MYILLEEGMIIKVGDEVINPDSFLWEQLSAGYLRFGGTYNKTLLPMRRKIKTIEELFTSYNSATMPAQGPA